MKRLIITLILLLISACTAEELNKQNIEPNIEMGSAEIRTSLETYNYAKIMGMEFKTSSIDGEKKNEIQIIDDYVLIGRKDNYSIGLHNIDYSLNTNDSTYMRRIYNFPIHSGETTIYYDESFLVDVGFNITIDPSFDGDLNK